MYLVPDTLKYNIYMTPDGATLTELCLLGQNSALQIKICCQQTTEAS